MKKIRGHPKKTLFAVSPPFVDSIEGLRDEVEPIAGAFLRAPGEILHAGPGEFQAIKSDIRGHGEQTVLPDDCEFGDNDLCAVET
jgi:hypothetical protein